MKLSFSTRGWEDLSFETLVDTAEEMRFAGIEIYNLPGRADLTGKTGAFHRYRVGETVRLLRGHGLSIPCFDSALDLSAEEDPTEKILSLLSAAAAARAPYAAAVALSDRDDRILPRLERINAYIEENGGCLLLKTSGVYADTARLRAVLDAFACDSFGALWDMHHTYRTAGESADATIRNLGAYVKHVHLRDSDDDNTYNLIGEGTLPVADMMRALSSIDYDGFISLEWKPVWMDDLTDREIIFPHFVN